MKYVFFDIECACVYKNVAKICVFGYCVADEQFNILEKQDILINPNGKFHLTDHGGRRHRSPVRLRRFQKISRFQKVLSPASRSCSRGATASCSATAAVNGRQVPQFRDKALQAAVLFLPLRGHAGAVHGDDGDLRPPGGARVADADLRDRLHAALRGRRRLRDHAHRAGDVRQRKLHPARTARKVQHPLRQDRQLSVQQLFVQPPHRISARKEPHSSANGAKSARPLQRLSSTAYASARRRTSGGASGSASPAASKKICPSPREPRQRDRAAGRAILAQALRPANAFVEEEGDDSVRCAAAHKLQEEGKIAEIYTLADFRARFMPEQE